jgi:hypothetical protein
MSTEPQTTPEAQEPEEPITDHAGRDLPEDIDFFAAPPVEIGTVNSAWSTLRQGVEPWSPALRGLMGGIGLLIGGGIGLIIGAFWEFAVVLWPVLLGAVGFLIGWFATGFKHTCTFIGDRGMARFICRGSRENVVTDEVFPFNEASELRTGRKRFVLNGTYHAEKSAPKPTDPFHFANAGEMAWSLHLLKQVPLMLQTKGAVFFSLGSNDWVSVAPGRLELCVRGQTTSCETEDIRSVSIDQGVFTVKRTDAKEGWFTSKGVFKFNYASLANAQLFLFVLDKLANVKIR